MTGVTRLQCSHNRHPELWLLLRAFPDVKELTLLDQHQLDDRLMQHLADITPRIHTLKLRYCHAVTPVGLLSAWPATHFLLGMPGVDGGWLAGSC